MVRDNLLAEARQYRDHQRCRRFWKKIVSVLGCAVVFCTTYALILPAITMEQETICGLEEHIHDESCWSTEPQASARLICTEEQLGLHRHDAGCYDENGLLVCGQADFVLHTHDESCYDCAGALVCPLPEIRAHIHDESCCEQPHVHSDGCYTLQQGELLCTVTEGTPHVHSDGCFTETRELTCTQTEEPGHRHTADCYAGTARLTCPLEETPGHIHGADCRDETGALICNLEEYEGHSHGDSCYTPEQTLTCPLQETEGHTHGDACYQTVTIQACPLAEGEPHVHTDACYQWTPVLTCQLPLPGEDAQPRLVCDLPEVVPHIHAETCFDADGSCICGLLQVEEHVHGQRCFLVAQDGERQLVLCCGLEEHTHTESCYPAEEQPVLTPGGEGEIRGCGLAEHLHGDGCYSLETGTLLCTMPEHLHSEECDTLPGEPEDGITELSYSGGDYTVSVVYGPEAGLPQGVTLWAEEILPDTEEYREYYTQSVEALDPASWSQPQTLVFARFFDVWFELDGEVYEPEAPVSVTITYDDGVEIGRTEECQAIHFAEDGLEILEVDTEDSRDGATSFTHTQDGFSVVGTLMTTTAYSLENPADAGPDKLPVDYYVYIDGEWTCVGTTKTGWYAPADASGWENTNRDCITVDQAASILGAYGFDPNAANNAALQIAYQRKETDKDANLHCDTQSYTDATKSNAALIPLARNADPASGYNVYFLPGNTNNNYSSKLETVAVSGSEFYTVSVYDPNHLAYAERDAIPGTQTIRTGGNAEVIVKALPENSGSVWQCVNDKWETVASDQDKGDRTVTFSIQDITQKLCITPIVNNLGTAVQKTVYFMVFLDGQWQNVGTTTPYYQNSNLLISGDKYRHFITSSQAESVLAPFGFRSSQYSSTVGGTSVLAHQLGQYDLHKEFWTDGGGQELSDSSWAIGLSYQTNGSIDYSVYYLPSNPEAFQAKKPSNYTADSAEMSSNSFWSVTVRDDTNTVYSDGELSGMVWYVANGGEATVTVRNADGILWSVSGASDVTSAQANGYTTFVIRNITQPIEVTATKANPGFTVQYYANIPRFATSGSNPLKVIDTSAAANSGVAKLPWNGGDMKTKEIYLEGTGKNTTQNAGAATQLYKVATTTELTKMYTDGTFRYEESPGLYYFNKLKDNESYTLKEIWVLKAGKDATSTNRADWDIYTYSTDTAFTNEAGQAAGNTILIRHGAVIRLVSDTSSGDYYNGTTFYDYNISDGQNADGRWSTGTTGINSESNYGTSSNGQRTWRSGADILAFGNANCGTGMSGYLFDGSTLNKYSSKNSGYGGATFKLASGLNSDGIIQYNEWIVAPKLFNDGDATGKQTYSGSSLTFDRVGDTYTLSAATLNNSNGQSNTLSGLQYFFNPSPTSGTTHTHIFTNNFWPMDPAAGRTDALWGKYGSPGSFQGYVESNNYNWSDLPANFPVSDDGKNHNWFFGMNFALNFNLTADYEGPLEYYFFGDDDLWVFLDGKLVCDIGGVHSSIGEYVNLRDYLPNGSSGQHTLSFFYTERGASGSTCYMSFTLPSVSSATTAQDTGSLKIEKKVEGGDGDYSKEEYKFKKEEYKFKVELLTSENGSPLNQTFSYSRSDRTYGTIKSGGTIVLRADENITISGIPAGTFYRVTEAEESRAGYKVTVNNNEGHIVSGKIETGAIKPANFVNTPYYELPSTGGNGTVWYSAGGLCLMAAAVLLYGRIRSREKERRSSP